MVVVSDGLRPWCSSSDSQTKGGEFFHYGHRVGLRGGPVFLELEDKVAAIINDERGTLRFAVERITRDRGSVQWRGRIWPVDPAATCSHLFLSIDADYG